MSRWNNLYTIKNNGHYDMAIIESYPDESIAYIAHQIRRENAAKSGLTRKQETPSVRTMASIVARQIGGEL